MREFFAPLIIRCYHFASSRNAFAADSTLTGGAVKLQTAKVPAFWQKSCYQLTTAFKSTFRGVAKRSSCRSKA
ncbi:hypothetical protein KCP75_16785 [Salmonella enterica subsp. enterica]|nr:hypothetical protein KCP75_16785 [Salmonella enterica subsp. enterica]